MLKVRMGITRAMVSQGAVDARPSVELLEPRTLLSADLLAQSLLSDCPDGALGAGHSWKPALSLDGHYVAYQSAAANLVPDDHNGKVDVFVRQVAGGEPQRVLAYDGQEPNESSGGVALSADGRFLVFESLASNLVANDGNGTWDVFLYDRQLNEIQRISQASDGGDANDRSGMACISGDGRYISYMSLASNIVEGDANKSYDVFLYDRQTPQTRRISVGAEGEGNSNSGHASLSADGRFLVFASVASNLVPDDTNAANDVFLYDQQTEQLGRVSLASGGQADSDSQAPVISGNGRFVAFESQATNLTDNDANNAWDVFVADTHTGAVERVSLASRLREAHGNSTAPAISFDGRFIAFQSLADDLVPNDHNASWDIFVHDRGDGTTTRASTTVQGTEVVGYSTSPVLAANGAWVAFESDAPGLVPQDPNILTDVFLGSLTHRSAKPGDVNGDGDLNNLDVAPFVAALADSGLITGGNADVNGDGAINLLDVQPFIQALTQPQVLRGDVNGDGKVDALDVNPFLLAFSGPYQAAADVNADGAVNLLDVAPFLAVLTQGHGAVAERLAAVSSVDPPRPSAPAGRHASALDNLLAGVPELF